MVVEGEPVAKRPAFEAPLELNAPNKILYIQQVPEGTTAAMLSGLFSKFAGFKDVKLPKAGLAFVFYENELNATQALTEYQGWKFAPDNLGLIVTYAKQ
jgi:U2 small nuclear ribonucleoprotein B''